VKRLQAGAAVLLTLALGACGSGSADPPALKDLAEKVGCTNMKQVDPEVFTLKQATCVKGPDSIELHTFSSENARDNWLDVAAEKDAGKIRHGDAWATVTSTGGESTDPPAEEPETPADLARQTKICAELFPADSDDWLVLQASDLVFAYLDSRDRSTIDVKAATKLSPRLQEVAERSPEPLATNLAAMADALTLLRDIGEGTAANDVDAVTVSKLLAGAKPVMIRCDHGPRD
jgi:hypothetical protein